MGSLRFLLALSVAGSHSASMFGFTGAWILSGSRAVQIFYIISGYLMAMILNGKYADSPHGNWIFYSNRALKIFAPYFAILVVTLAICLLSKAINGNALLLEPWFAEAGNMALTTWIFALLTNFFIIGQEWGYLLVYRAGTLFWDLNAFERPPIAAQFTVIAPAWTLSIELIFYFLAPFILRRNVLLIAALACSSHWLRLEGYHLGFYSEATNYRFFPFELSLFLYGAICFRIGGFLPTPNVKVLASIYVVTVLTIAFLPQYLNEHQYWLYLCLGLLLPPLFEFSRHAPWDRQLGDLSYPLYLAHWPVAAFAAVALRYAPPNSIYPSIAVVLSIAAALGTKRYIVAPLDGWRQRRAATSDNPDDVVTDDGRLHGDKRSAVLT